MIAGFEKLKADHLASAAAYLGTAGQAPLTAELLRNFAEQSILTLEYETYQTIAGVLESRSKVDEALNILRAVELGEFENDIQALRAFRSDLELWSSGQSKVGTLMAGLKLSDEEMAVIGATLNKFFTHGLSIVESTEKFIVNHGLN
jgi:hypothetical protein